ncbi:MAG TPA: glutathione S-transferase family protein [Novosphingobium sp.]|nr:glutathione S-transferase family protein [Novosphingobium sp.]
MLTYYTNPQSRGQIPHWMLEEVGQPYATEVVAYDKIGDAAYRAVNPMAKVPALVDDGKVVTECAAIVAYLAERFLEAGLAPTPDERADYYRWLFFTAGPLEQAVISKAMGWTIDDPARGRMLGFGDFERPLNVLSEHLAGRDYVCGARFTAADVYVGSQVDWGLQFGTFPATRAFTAYAERLRERPAYKRCKAINAELMQAAA